MTDDYNAPEDVGALFAQAGEETARRYRQVTKTETPKTREEFLAHVDKIAATHPHWRHGQTVSNVAGLLGVVPFSFFGPEDDPTLYGMPDDDPYYDDSKVEAFLDRLFPEEK